MERFVYYLEDPTAAVSALDGSRSKRFREKVESFLDSPRSTFEKRLSPHVRQIKHRGSKTRAFTTWCQDDEREVLVVQVVYRKRNEERFFEHLDEYDEEGKQFRNQFQSLSDDEFEAWRRSVKDSDDVLLAES